MVTSLKDSIFNFFPEEDYSQQIRIEINFESNKVIIQKIIIGSFR